MLIRRKREITQEMYERNKDRGTLSREDEEQVFTQAEMCGYGVYGTQVVAGDDGKYYVFYEIGDSCD